MAQDKALAAIVAELSEAHRAFILSLPFADQIERGAHLQANKASRS